VVPVLLRNPPSKEASMAESRDWNMADRRNRNEDLMSGIGDEDITGRPDEEEDEEFEDAEELEDEDEIEESDR
jgi:hypothetical protein